MTLSIVLSEYRRTLGGSTPSQWVRIDTTNLSKLLLHLRQYDELQVDMHASDEGISYISVYARRYTYFLCFRRDYKLGCISVQDLLPFLHGFNVVINDTLDYWGWDDL